MLISDLATVGAAVAAIVGLLTAFSILAKGVTNVTNHYAAWRKRLKSPKYIIVPSAEEIAKYSLKSSQWYEEKSLWVERSYLEVRYQYLDRVTRARILLVMAAFAFMYAILGMRIIEYGIRSMF